MKKETIKFINFIDLTADQKKVLLDLRNHPEVRKWMYNSNLISLENHLIYIDSLKDEETKKYFLVETDKQTIGVIYFTKIDLVQKSSEFGLYANLFDKQSNIGNTLMRLVISYAFNDLKLKSLNLEVFENNERAITLYNRFGFKQVCQKNVNNKKVICMELYNENR